jgi:hypothetical protein
LAELTSLRSTLPSKASTQLIDETFLHNKKLHSRTFC